MPLAVRSGLAYGPAMRTTDPDYIAFRELLRQAGQNPTLAARLTIAMREAWELRDVLSLSSSAAGPASDPATRTPDSAADDR